MSARRPAAPDPDAPRELAPLRLLRKLLFGHVQLERCEGSLRVSLQERGTAAAPTPSEPAPSEAEALAETLRSRLAEDPQARRAFPHLRVLTHALRRQGWAALGDVPEPALNKMLAQLDVLLGSDPRLQELQQRLLAERHEREAVQVPPTLPFGLGPSDYLPGDKLEVREAALSDFLREAGKKD